VSQNLLYHVFMHEIGKWAIIVPRQFFFAAGKPHRPMDAKLTGEEARRFIPLAPQNI